MMSPLFPQDTDASTVRPSPYYCGRAMRRIIGFLYTTLLCMMTLSKRNNNVSVWQGTVYSFSSAVVFSQPLWYVPHAVCSYCLVFTVLKLINNWYFSLPDVSAFSAFLLLFWMVCFHREINTRTSLVKTETFNLQQETTYTECTTPLWKPENACMRNWTQVLCIAILRTLKSLSPFRLVPMERQSWRRLHRDFVWIWTHGRSETQQCVPLWNR